MQADISLLLIAITLGSFVYLCTTLGSASVFIIKQSTKPIYIQIAKHIKMKIISQEIKSGDQLPTVRELAEEAGVNPNTMQRAFSELEHEGMVF